MIQSQTQFSNLGTKDSALILNPQHTVVLVVRRLAMTFITTSICVMRLAVLPTVPASTIAQVSMILTVIFTHPTVPSSEIFPYAKN
jgi:hypothetical protein